MSAEKASSETRTGEPGDGKPKGRRGGSEVGVELGVRRERGGGRSGAVGVLVKKQCIRVCVEGGRHVLFGG